MAINSGRSRLAAYVALAYTLVIVYASLQPFDGWRMPPAALFDFLLAPWPRYVTSSDIVLNVAAYLPFGAMLVVALRPRCTGASGIAARLEKALGGPPYQVQDWYELNHNLFTALNLQKLALVIILTLIMAAFVSLIDRVLLYVAGILFRIG